MLRILRKSTENVPFRTYSFLSPKINIMRQNVCVKTNNTEAQLLEEKYLDIYQQSGGK